MKKSTGGKLNIPDEVLEKIMMLDCRKQESIRRLKKSLMKLPFVKSEEDTTTDRLEELIKRIESKYGMTLGYVMRFRDNEDYSYTGMIKDKEGKWIRTAYGQTFWETLAKTLFFMAYHIDKNKKNKK